MLTLALAAGEARAPGQGRKVNEWLNHCGDVYARAFSWGDSHWIHWRGLGVFAFSTGSHQVRVWPESDIQYRSIVDTFSRILQPVILQALGWEALHAGAAVAPAGVLAFCGRAGSGKSTLAFAMQQAGWKQFADDALVLRLDQDCVTACPLPFRPELKPASRAHFGNAHLPPAQQTQPDVPLVGVFLLKQDIGLMSPRVSLIPKARAFVELLAHAHCFDLCDSTHRRRLVDDYLRVAARVPIFTLEYQPNFQHLPQLTRAVVEAVTIMDPSADGASELWHAALAP